MLLDCCHRYTDPIRNFTPCDIIVSIYQLYMVAAVSDSPLDNSLDNLIDNPSGNSMDNSLDNPIVLDLIDGTGSTSSTSSTSSLFSS